MSGISKLPTYLQSEAQEYINHYRDVLSRKFRSKDLSFPEVFYQNCNFKEYFWDRYITDPTELQGIYNEAADLRLSDEEYEAQLQALQDAHRDRVETAGGVDALSEEQKLTLQTEYDLLHQELLLARTQGSVGDLPRVEYRMPKKQYRAAETLLFESYLRDLLPYLYNEVRLLMEDDVKEIEEEVEFVKKGLSGYNRTNPEDEVLYQGDLKAIAELEGYLKGYKSLSTLLETNNEG